MVTNHISTFKFLNCAEKFVYMELMIKSMYTIVNYLTLKWTYNFLVMSTDLLMYGNHHADKFTQIIHYFYSIQWPQHLYSEDEQKCHFSVITFVMTFGHRIKSLLLCDVTIII